VATVTEVIVHRRRAPQRRADLLPALMIGAAVVACFAVATLLVVILWLSFTDGTPGMELDYTLANFADMFLDRVTYLVIGNTFAFAATTLCVALLIGLPMAWLIERTDFPGKRAVFTLCHVAEQSTSDVSAALGVSEATVRVHLFRAVRRLRTLLAPPPAARRPGEVA